MWITIDHNCNTSLSKQIYNQIKHTILTGSLIAGEKLPSTRELAQDLCVSRNTILEAYNQLIAEGYLEGVHGSGTLVANGIQKLTKTISTKPGPSFLDTSLKTESLIDFRTGIPDLTYFPRKNWLKAYQETLLDSNASTLLYSSPLGVPKLRNAISQYLTRTRGINCTPDNVVIVTGATQGLSLVSKLLFHENHPIALFEDPTHNGLLQAIRSSGYNIMNIPADDYGLMTNCLPQAEQIAFIYTTPSHQYPLGGILPIQRRQELIKYAIEKGSYIIEDDYDSEYRYEGYPVSTLYELNSEHVIYIGSFSKIMAPAIRLGYMIIPDMLMPKYKNLKMYSDVHTEATTQHAMANFIESGDLENHIRKMKKIYSKKRTHLIKEFTSYYKGEFEIKGQAAGLHLIIKIKDIEFNEALIADIKKEDIKVYPLEHYVIHHKENHKNEIILGYGHLSIDQITKGIIILCTILNKLVP